VGRQLRRERSALALALGVGDLAGLLSFEQVTQSLSDLADRSLQSALAAAIEARTPGAEQKGFAVIALGKHGSRELNYSSDVDLIFLYDPAALP
jgi:glutamate-ammonia-ligase adenylyltransferase